MQIRHILDRTAFWLSVVLLLGATAAGIFQSCVSEGSLPGLRLRARFGGEIQKLIGEGDYSGALAQMKLAADYDPAQRAQMLESRISFAWRIGDLNAQKEAMREVAISGLVYDPSAYAGFALMLLEPYAATQGENIPVDAETVELAVEYAERALELDPGFAMAHYDLGVASLFQNDREKAAECFRKALQAAPDLAKAQVRLQQLQLTATTR